jgi:hypothetical protein
MDEPAAVIARLFPGMTIPGRRYPTPLPPALARWYCYIPDGGHQVVIALPAYWRPDADPREFLCPAPVKAVLAAGYLERDGYVVCDLPYDEHGLNTDPAFDEYGDAGES